MEYVTLFCIIWSEKISLIDQIFNQIYEGDTRASRAEAAATEEEGRKMPDVEVKEVMGGGYNGQIMWALEALAKHLECQGESLQFGREREHYPT